MALTLENHDRRIAAVEQAQSETTETLRWVVTKLARLQAVQDEHTLRLERLEFKVDAMQSKVEALPRAMAELIDAAEKRMMSQVEARLDALPRAIAEMVEASEKRVMAAVAARG